MAISPDHDSVLVGFESGLLVRYSLPHGEKIWENSDDKSVVSRIAFSPSGDRFAVGGYDGLLRVFAAGGRQPKVTGVYSNHVDVINDLAFSPDGHLLATASVGGQARLENGRIMTSTGAGTGQIALLNLATGQLRTYPTHNGEAFSVQFDKTGGRLVSAGDGGEAIIWRVQNDQLQEVRKLTTGSDMLYAADFSPDGSRVVTAGRAGLLSVVDTATGKEIFELAGHENAILRLAFTPTGGQVITTGTDRTIRFWDMQLGRQTFDLRLPVEPENKEPLWDFDFDYRAGAGGWMAVPLTNGKLLLYRLDDVFDVSADARP